MRFEGKAFNDATIKLDGNEYSNCNFTRCVLVYGGGELPTLNANTFTGSTWQFDDAAARTVSFLRGLYSGGGKELVERTLENIKAGADIASPTQRPAARGVVRLGGNTFRRCALPLVALDRCFIIEPGNPPLVTVVTERDGQAVIEVFRNVPQVGASEGKGTGVITVTDKAGRFTYKVRPASETSVVFGTLRGEEIEVRITDRAIRVLRRLESGELELAVQVDNSMFDGVAAGVVVDADGGTAIAGPIPERLRRLFGA
jgi:hypothetical protein